jgi:hypothetical protein
VSKEPVRRAAGRDALALLLAATKLLALTPSESVSDVELLLLLLLDHRSSKL